MGPNFLIEMICKCLILPSLSKKWPRKQFTNTRGADYRWLGLGLRQHSVTFYWDNLYLKLIEVWEKKWVSWILYDKCISQLENSSLFQHHFWFLSQSESKVVGGGQLPLCIKDPYKFQSREDPCSIDLEPWEEASNVRYCIPSHAQLHVYVHHLNSWQISLQLLSLGGFWLFLLKNVSAKTFFHFSG